MLLYMTSYSTMPHLLHSTHKLLVAVLLLHRTKLICCCCCWTWPKTRDCAAYRTPDCNIDVRIFSCMKETKNQPKNILTKTFTKIDFGQWPSSAYYRCQDRGWNWHCSTFLYQSKQQKWFSMQFAFFSSLIANVATILINFQQNFVLVRSF